MGVDKYAIHKSKIVIAGKQYYLSYNMAAERFMHEKHGMSILAAIDRITRGDYKPEVFVDMIWVGLTCDGANEDVTTDWLEKNMRFDESAEYALAIAKAVNRAIPQDATVDGLLKMSMEKAQKKISDSAKTTK